MHTNMYISMYTEDWILRYGGNQQRWRVRRRHTCTYIYMHANMYVSMYTEERSLRYEDVSSEDMYVCTPTHACICIYRYIHTYTYIYTDQKRLILRKSAAMICTEKELFPTGGKGLCTCIWGIYTACICKAYIQHACVRHIQHVYVSCFIQAVSAYTHSYEAFVYSMYM